MRKIFKNYARRSSSLKTNWQIKSFTETYSEPCQTSEKVLLAKIVISFSFFCEKLYLKMFERVPNTPLLHGHFSYAKNLNLPFMKSHSRDSLCDQNDCSEMRRN